MKVLLIITCLTFSAQVFAMRGKFYVNDEQLKELQRADFEEQREFAPREEVTPEQILEATPEEIATEAQMIADDYNANHPELSIELMERELAPPTK